MTGRSYSRRCAIYHGVLPVLSCALLLSAWAARAQDTRIRALIDACNSEYSGDACEKLEFAVTTLTDQAALADIVVDTTAHNGLIGRRIRKSAFLRMTDQKQIARVACDAWKGEEIPAAAIGKLTDQKVLEDLALDYCGEDTQAAAIGRITDQATLARIAAEFDSEYPGKPKLAKEAVEKLTDQTLLVSLAMGGGVGGETAAQSASLTDQMLLARIATEAKDQTVRAAAVAKLADQTLLAKIATQDSHWYVREAAIERLTDETLILKLARTDRDPVVRAAAVAAMDPHSPFLRTLAGNLAGPTTDAREAIARVKLGLQSPRIKGRFPTSVFDAGVGSVFRTYGAASPKPGEVVIFTLTQNGKTLATASWESEFPIMTSYFGFLPAKVHTDEFLKVFLRDPAFDEGDLAALSTSDIPELRKAAKERLAELRLGAAGH